MHREQDQTGHATNGAKSRRAASGIWPLASGLFCITAITPLAAQTWSVDAKPSFDVRGAPENAFTAPIGAVRLANGRVVVGDKVAAGAQLLLFDPTGRFIRTTGRAGDGPGEFRYVGWLGRCAGDTVTVWDLRHRRMTLVDNTGIVVREFRVPVEGSKDPSPANIACSGNTMATQPGPQSFATTENAMLRRGLSPITMENAVRRTKATTPLIAGDELFVFGGGGTPRPLGKTTSFAVASDRLFVGTADSAFVDVYGLDGKPLAPIAVGVPRAAATRAASQRAITAIVNQLPPQFRDTVQKLLRQLPVPASMPPYHGLLTDPDDNLWVVLSAADEPTTRLRVFDKTGKLRANVTVPARLHVTDIGRDYILGTLEDQSSEMHVVAYRFRRQ